jgi:hypothetical protein
MRISKALPVWITILLSGCCLSLVSAEPADQLARSIAPVQLQVPLVPRPFTGDGCVGLAYELHLANFRNIEFALKQVDVFAMGDPGNPIATLAGTELLACLLRPGKPADLADPEVLCGGEFAVVFLWVTMDSAVSAPPSVGHRATLTRALDDGSRKEYIVEGGVARVSGEKPIRIYRRGDG